MKKLKILIMMQLKDKLDFSWTETIKSRIQKIVLSIIKFLLVLFITFFILKYAQTLNLFIYSEIIQVMIVIVTLLLLLSTISCTVGLMKNLYYADDNRVLITFPVSGNMLFFSKLIVFYIYELKKSVNLFIPLILACLLVTNGNHMIFWPVFLWMWIPLLFIIALPVLIGALLSIPCLFISRFFKKYPIVELIIILLCVGLGVYGVVYLIGLIPQNIDLINQWPIIRQAVHDFLVNFENKFFVMSQLVHTLTGEYIVNMRFFLINGITMLKFLAIVGATGLLGVLAYLISRPLFFTMMTKSFEFDKRLYDRELPNAVHKPFITFVNKEFKVNFRSIEISGNYLAVYILIPILILLLNSLFAAMDTKLSGSIMTYSFNLLLILLPLLASNSMIATMFSKEGRAGYIKKTKPINPIIPLFSKLFFNLLLSIPCIAVTMFIFGKFSGFGVWNVILLGVGILLIQYGHIFYSATLDIMNPQNEQYATVGEEISNPNENKSTLIAFVIAALVALVSYKLFSESILYTNSFWLASFKIMLIGAAIFVSTLAMFILKVKAYYCGK